jgi:diaminopimelate decarboxylase
MNDLLRPTLYEGWHQIVPLTQPTNDKVEKVDVVGPICESGDFLAQNREIPLVAEGDYLAVLSAGAYGFTMASNYNTRPMPAEILVEDEKVAVVRERQTLDDVLKGEHIA